MLEPLSILLYITADLDALRSYSRGRHLRRINNILRQFPEDQVHIVCHDHNHDLISAGINNSSHILTCYSSITLPLAGSVQKPVMIIRDAYLCLSRPILDFWNEKASHLHTRKLVEIKSPFPASALYADLQIVSADVVKYLCEQHIAMQRWLEYISASAIPLMTRESLYHQPEHLSEIYKRYMEDTEFPEAVMIEPTTHCAMRCHMCPYHADQYANPAVGPYIHENKFQHMGLELFKRLIDEMASYDVISLIPQYRGEPFMHPNLIPMLRYARDRGMTNISFPTNGFLLNDRLMDEILDLDLAALTFSFDGLTRETYSQIRRNSDFDLVRNNIFKFRNKRDQRGLKRPLIQMTFVELTENRHEREAYIKFWTQEVDLVRINIGLSYNELHSQHPFGFSLKGYNHRPPCPLILSQGAITADGKLILCHTDSTESTILADLRRSSIREGYNCHLMQSIRKAHLAGEFAIRPICKDCQIWKADYYETYENTDCQIYGGTWWINYKAITTMNSERKRTL